MINIKKELELIGASNNGNLDKVKNLLETNKFHKNTLEKAKSVAINNMHFDVASYLQKEIGKICANKILPKEPPTDL